MSNTNLDISVERPGGLEHRLTIRVPNADIEREVDARLQKVGRTARLKGFRPGKVPQKVVRRHYGGQVRQEVLSEVIRNSYSQAIQQEQLNPAGGPRIEALPEEDQEHFAFQAIFEVFPEIEISDLGQLAIERPRVEITEDDVEAMMQKLREQRAEWREVERKAERGDRIVVDFTGRLDGEPFEGGEAKEITITIGSSQVIEDFDKALEGLGAGDQKTVEVQFPDDYGVETLKGRKAEFDITAHRVEEKVLPELDEEFAKLFGVEEGGLDALRNEVRSNMQRELDERLKNHVKTQMLDALLEANEVTTPKALVDDEIRNLQQDAMRRMGIEDESGAPPPERFEAAAQRRVAVGLLLQELIRANGIELDRPRV